LKIKTILVAFDFSACASHAFEKAVELAHMNDANLVILHAFELNDRLYPYNAFLTERILAEGRKAAKARLEAWRSEAVDGGVAIEIRLSSEEASEAIVGTAQDVEADLIVMGTRGLTGIRHVLVGSVTERTLAKAPCPVVVVRQRETEAEAQAGAK